MLKTKTAPMQMQVQVTKDYKMFKSLIGNRSLNTLHLKRLEKSMRANPLVTILTTNQRNEIIDGQHRFYVSRKLGLPIYYIVASGYGLEEVQVLNANTKNWGFGDMLASYCDLGYEEYIDFRTFREKYGFNYGTCIQMLGGEDSGRLMHQFKTGDFKVKNYTKSCKLADELIAFKDVFPKYKSQGFTRAMLKFMRNKDFKPAELLKKLSRNPKLLGNEGSRENFELAIERIYNRGRHQKINLRFPGK